MEREKNNSGSNNDSGYGPPQLHVRLKNDDSDLTKRGMRNIAKELSKMEGENICMSEAARRLLKWAIVRIRAGHNLKHAVEAMIDIDFRYHDGKKYHVVNLKKEMKDIKLRELTDTVDDLTLYDVYQLAMNNGIREKLQQCPLSTLMNELYARAKVEHKKQEEQAAASTPA